MISDYKDISSFIISNYPHANKIVEIGIGKEDSVFLELKKIFGERVLATDLDSEKGDLIDDITEPNLPIYHGANLIYSVRPPPELIPYLRRIACDVGADLLIRPMSTDACAKQATMELVNYKKALLWSEKR
jgi:uncharacterized UPF0146 family protein